MMQRILAIFFTGLVWSPIEAQQVAQYTQWQFHQLALNPAHAGIKKCIDLHAIYRHQWAGFDGAPRTGTFTASFPLESRRRQLYSARHGLGMRLETDRHGLFSSNRINLAYAGHFNFTTETRLSLGLYAGAMQYGLDPNGSITTSPDQALYAQSSFLVPDAHFGAWWNGKNYYVGLILNQLIPYNWPAGQSSSNQFHTQINGGYRWTLGERWTFLPGALLKVPTGGPVAFDLNAHLDFSNRISFGLGLRNGDALLGFFQVKFNEQFAIHYSYDFTISRLNRTTTGTHELSISFTGCKPDRMASTNCPLFF